MKSRFTVGIFSLVTFAILSTGVEGAERPERPERPLAAQAVRQGDDNERAYIERSIDQRHAPVGHEERSLRGRAVRRQPDQVVPGQDCRRCVDREHVTVGQDRRRHVDHGHVEVGQGRRRYVDRGHVVVGSRPEIPLSQQNSPPCYVVRNRIVPPPYPCLREVVVIEDPYFYNPYHFYFRL